jgi:macrolide transport system ATP-binding/permease protein
LAEPPAVDPGGEDAAAVPLVELRGITRRYATGTLALSGISIRLHRGESVAVIGRSGSGKSTLLNLLGLLDVPDEGELLIDGHRVEGDDDRRRTERRATDLGFVFQRSHLIPALTARENVLLGLRYSHHQGPGGAEAADEALRAVGLGAKVDAVARTLSGGEMQRVAIARTLVRPAQLWLADEPTGNLDSAQSVEIIELLKERAAQRGACLVVVTHEPDIAARMGRTITLHDGRVVADTGAAGADLRRSAPGARSDADADAPGAPSLRARTLRTARFIAQGVRAHPRRAWSGILASALAVALTIAALGLAQSASAQVTSLFDAQRASQVTARFSNDPAIPPRWPVQVDAVEEFSGVTGVEYWRTFAGVPMTNGEVAADTATVVAVDAAPGPATDSSVTWAAHDSHALEDGEVVLGAVLADRLGVGQLDMTPEVVIGGVRLRVVGILTASRSGTAAGSAFVTSASTTGIPESSSAELYVETVPGAARHVADRLPDLADPYRVRQLRIDPVLTADAYRGSLEDSVSASLQVLAVVAALAGLLAVVFVTILSVSARTSEFGVRRAFGARRSELVSLVVGESTVLGVAGAVVGLATGFIAVMAVTASARWQPVFEPRLLLVPLVGALVFGPLGGLLPSITAGRVQPADAVRS